MFVEQRPLFRQSKPPRIAFRKLDAEPGLEGGKPPAGGGRRRAQRRGTGGDSAGFNDAAEELDVPDAVRHFSPHVSI
ncbi:hypothetical protein HAP54_000020790 [Bradyrhizobium sp. 2S1]|nr:hypothetical protein [Bradyrhizobium sp. 2S1]MCK7673000.1 hypothetical protein [Bradyrhizobium sp. 2S1]